MINTPDDLADYRAVIQENPADALIEYQKSNPDLIDLMERFPYMNTMIRNVLANAWVRGNMAAHQRNGSLE